jgi:predicted N-acetyltransferase YhbS
MDTRTAELLDLMVDAFKPGDAELRRIFGHDLTAEDPPAERVVLEDGGRPVAALLIFHRHMRLGASVVRTGSIGAVAASRSARGQGLGRRLMEAAHDRARALGLPWLHLIGIDHFYHKLGYRSCLAEESLTVPLAHLPAADGAGSAASEADAAAIIALYEASYRDGAWLRARSVRSLDLQLQRNRIAWSDLRVLRRNQTIAAYHLRRGDRIWEAGANDASAAAWVWADAGAARLAELQADPKQDAAARSRAGITVAATPGHPCRQVLADRPFTTQRSQHAYGGQLGLVLDQHAFVTAIAADLGSRAAVLGLGGIDLEVDGTSHRIDAGSGRRVRIATSTGHLLTAVSGVAAPSAMGMTGDPVLLDAVFPQRAAGFSRLDYF